MCENQKRITDDQQNKRTIGLIGRCHVSIEEFIYESEDKRSLILSGKNDSARRKHPFSPILLLASKSKV